MSHQLFDKRNFEREYLERCMYFGNNLCPQINVSVRVFISYFIHMSYQGLEEPDQVRAEINLISKVVFKCTRDDVCIL